MCHVPLGFHLEYAGDTCHLGYCPSLLLGSPLLPSPGQRYSSLFAGESQSLGPAWSITGDQQIVRE